ncbi:hypothetical protein ODW18_24350, partial [Escherichia coli]|nr:hypothetical protein [Escherichia coli]
MSRVISSVSTQTDGKSAAGTGSRCIKGHPLVFATAEGGVFAVVSKGGHTGQAVNVGAVELALGCTIYAVGASRTGEGGRNSGEKSCIATRVAGSEPLKISTPAS